jgi:acyl-coenzyme A thioesterase PaaI-like protein
MPPSTDAPGARLRAHWKRLAPLPGGKWAFSRLLGLMVPYTASIRARVERFDPGRVRVSLADHRRIRNHLRSVHAIALANLGELATGLAVLGALGSGTRGILTGLEVSYLKKARGRLVAEASCDPPEVLEATERIVQGTITDHAGDVVATVRARWLLSPVPTDR